MVLDAVGRDAILLVDDLEGAIEFVKRIGHAKAVGLEQIEAAGARQHHVGDPRDAVNRAILVAHRLDCAGQEVGEVPVGRRPLRVLDELVERRQPAGADPAAGIDEGDVQHVEAAALGRQLEVGALVVDREARRVVVDLDAGLLSKFRDVLREQGWVGRAPARNVEGHALERLLAALRRRLA